MPPGNYCNLIPLVDFTNKNFMLVLLIIESVAEFFYHWFSSRWFNPTWNRTGVYRFIILCRCFMIYMTLFFLLQFEDLTFQDFDLSNRSYGQVGHEHKMEQMGLGLDVDSHVTRSPVPINRRQSVEQCINSLVHACQCKKANCAFSACARMKKVSK